MPKSWSHLFTLTIWMPLLLALLVACGVGVNGNPNGSAASTGSTVIKIATDYPASGQDASAGKSAENGAHLAVDEANQNNFLPGYKFVFLPKNDAGTQGIPDPAIGQRNITDLMNDALVTGVVGPLNNSVAQSELPVANQAPIALISPSNTNNCLTQTTPDTECGGANNKISMYRPTGKVTYFRIATLDQFQGRALADFGFKTKGYKKAYVVDDAGTFGVDIANIFSTEWTKLGGTIPGHQSVPSTTTSYSSVLTQIATTNPDVIFFGGNDSTGGIKMRQQMVQIPGLKQTPVIGGDGMQTSNFAKTIGHDGGGPVFTSQASIDASKLDTAKDFIARYDAVYGATNLSSYSAGSYDCAKIILLSIRAVIQKGIPTPKDSTDTAQARVFRQAIIDAIQTIDYNGVSGHQSFDKNGDTTNRALTIKTIADDVNQGDGWTPIDIIKI